VNKGDEKIIGERRKLLWEGKQRKQRNVETEGRIIRPKEEEKDKNGDK
jgi:hypothetical protein